MKNILPSVSYIFFEEEMPILSFMWKIRWSKNVGISDKNLMEACHVEIKEKLKSMIPDI